MTVSLGNVQLAATPMESPNLQLVGLSNFSGDIQLTRQEIYSLLYTQLQTDNYFRYEESAVSSDTGSTMTTSSGVATTDHVFYIDCDW